MWKDFFYFTKEERTGIYVLIVLIAIIISACFFISLPEGEGAKPLSEKEREEMDCFFASLSKRKNDRKYRSKTEVKEVVLSPFDPNTADSAEFIRLGLRPYVARNILRYRAKGGKFRTPEAFCKIYGITPEQFNALLPYIYIGEKFRIRTDTIRKNFAKDSARVFKYFEGTTIDLNDADTAELKKIPGIGSGIARTIVAYRSRLGGFHSVEQLQELKHIPQNMNRWFYVGSQVIRKINLNKAGIERISSHPYINFYQAKVIVEYRKKKGQLKNLNQLALYEEFSPEDLEKISHYVEF